MGTMLNKLTQFLAVALLGLLHSSVFALTLGDEEVFTTLGEPVLVEIEILQTEGVALDRLNVGLASEANFTAFGIDYLPMLADLQFSIPEQENDATLKLVVTSSTPMQEPYMELLLLVSWPGGSLLREYILLFDLPAPVSSEPIVVAEPALEAAPEQTTQVVGIVEAEPEAQPANVLRRQRYRVQAGDTLWSIARRFHTPEPGYTIYQTLIGLHDLNRGAFINENVSLVKTNHELLIPTIDDLDAINFNTASTMYIERWEEGVERYEAIQRGDSVAIFSSLAPAVEFAAEEPQRADEPSVNPQILPAQELPQEVSESSLMPATPSSTNEMGVDPIVAGVTESNDELLERVSLAAISIQELMRTREIQLQQLEAQVAEMREQLKQAQTVAASLTESMAVVVAERESQAEVNKRETLTFIAVDFALILALLAAVVMILRLSAQLKKSPIVASASAAVEYEDESEIQDELEIREEVLVERAQEEMDVETMPYEEVNQSFEDFEDYSFEGELVTPQEPAEKFEAGFEAEPEEFIDSIELEGLEPSSSIADNLHEDPDYSENASQSEPDSDEEKDDEESECIPFYIEPANEFDDDEDDPEQDNSRAL